MVLKDSVADPVAVARKQASKFAGTVGFVYRKALTGYSVTLSTAAVSNLQADPTVAYVVPDETVSAADQYVSTGIRRIHGDQSSTQSGDGSGSVDINVAVLDSGIDAAHPDLNVVGGADCSGSRDKNFGDEAGHGTQVGGFIGAKDNALGVVGIAPGARLWSVRVLNKQGFANGSSLLCGIDWVTATRTDADPTNDIPVANVSIGGIRKNQVADDGNCGLTNKDPVHLAICASTAAGVTYVFSAGNEHTDIQHAYPAGYDEVLTATAIDDIDGLPGGLVSPDPCGAEFVDDAPAFFSNFATLASDQAHTVSAPGVCLSSTNYLAGCATRENPQPTECYTGSTGTSFASPLVAGTVALCIASGACAGLTPPQIIQKVVNDAAVYNTTNPTYGYTGDPLRPIPGKYFGYLVRAGAY